MELKSQQCLIELHDLAHEEYRRFEEERNMLLQCLHAVAQLKQEREEELQQLQDRLSKTNEDIRLLEREKERLEQENSKAKEAKERYQYLGIRENRAFASPGLSLLRTSMMMFELDFIASFNEPYTDDDEKSLYFGGATIFLLVVFVLLMPILLMNLLIGLAVGDIESVQKNATLKRLAMQVELHTNLERKLPFRLLDMVDKAEYTYYPNKCIGHLEKLWSKMSFLNDLAEGDETLSYNEHMYEELYKMKIRMKKINSNMEKQYDLLRLVVQKMEIHTEDDNRDEGFSESFDVVANIQKTSRWTPAKNNLVRQSAIVSQWKHSLSDAV